MDLKVNKLNILSVTLVTLRQIQLNAKMAVDFRMENFKTTCVKQH